MGVKHMLCVIEHCRDVDKVIVARTIEGSEGHHLHNND
jgi:hypothetical protein